MTYYGSKELAASFRTVRGNTIAAAKDIPEDKYDFRPTPECRSVEKMLTHIALVYRFQHQFHVIDKRTDFEGFDFPAFMGQMSAIESQSRTKQQVIDLLEHEGGVWAGVLDGLSEDFLSQSVAMPPSSTPPTKSRFEMILSVKEHEMHHRAQIMLVQRLLGMVPHLTQEREARMAQASAGS